MKRTIWLFGVTVAGVLALSGCSKAEKAPPATQIAGVTVDMPKLQQALATASPDVQAQLGQVVFGLRYGMYTNVLVALDKIARNPSLTEPQKKTVSDVIEQVKELIAKAPPKGAP